MTQLFICGFMGAGKTTLGSLLSKCWGLPVFDTDIILARGYEKPAGEQLAANPLLFRQREAKLIKDLSAKSGGIIVLGGGALENHSTQASLRGLPLLWLDPGVDICWHRVSIDTYYRPLAQNYEDFLSLYHRRVPFYRESARWHLQSVSPPEELVKEIFALGLGPYGA